MFKRFQKQVFRNVQSINEIEKINERKNFKYNFY